MRHIKKHSLKNFSVRMRRTFFGELLISFFCSIPFLLGIVSEKSSQAALIGVAGMGSFFLFNLYEMFMYRRNVHGISRFYSTNFLVVGIMSAWTALLAILANLTEIRFFDVLYTLTCTPYKVFVFLGTTRGTFSSCIGVNLILFISVFLVAQISVLFSRRR
ncbi:MAG: hypothetical protein MJ078_04090 [Clostridia bacterium]|nr:hypothetical protein [Clostridia bacterium]